MTLPPLVPLGLFMAVILLASTYGLAASGHFPASDRLPAMRGQFGAVVIWSTAIVASLALCLAIVFASRTVSWPTAVIGGGVMVLVAPMLLNAFPDTVVDGKSGLIGFAGGALAVACLAVFGLV